MHRVNYNGLKRRDTYDEIANYIETDPNKIRYPDRTATFIEQSHQMKMLGGQAYADMEDQQENNIKEDMKDGLLRRAAGKDGKTKSVYKAASEPDPTQIFDIASDKDEEMADQAREGAAKIQVEKDRKLAMEIAAGEMGKASV